MRTEQHLRGYDSCRSVLQEIIAKNPKLQENEELMKLAQYPYYEEDGVDWIPDCYNCKNRVLDIDCDYVCKFDITLKDIKICGSRVESE